MTDKYNLISGFEECELEQALHGDNMDLSNAPLFIRPEWFRIHEQYAGQAGASKIIAYQGEKGLSALLPFKQLNYDYKLFQVKHLNSMSNYYSPMFEACTNGQEPPEYADLVQGASEFFRQFDTTKLCPLTYEQALSWQAAFDRAGFKSHIYYFSVNWFHDNITGIESFWSQRSNQLKNTIKRKRRKLEKSGEYKVCVTDCADADLAMQLKDYHQVYEKSWKQEEASTVFIDQICQYQNSLGELRLGFVYHHEKPVAAQLWFVNGQTAYIYKLAYDEEYTNLSVGTVLSAEIFEYVITKDKVTKIDFLTGDDPYKKDWMNNCQKLYGLQVCHKLRPGGMFHIFYNYLSIVKNRILLKG